MDRRRFVLSWGRKIFFGLGWPLFCILALLFFKSDVFPKDALSIFYYVVTSLGFFGVLTTVLYFIFYVPLALIFPTYYFVRLWSSFLILIFSAAILLDAQVFGEYRFHINKVILNVFSDSPGKIFNDSLGPYYLTLGAVIFLFVVFWIRGEILWRVMQRRFSNPVKSWYLIFILLCMGASHLTWRYQVRTSFYGNGITLASLFPWNYQTLFYPKVFSTSAAGTAHFNFPKKELKCDQKSQTNMIFIVLENFKSSDLSEERTPFIHHLQQHGMSFISHLSGGGAEEDMSFRLIHGITATHKPESGESILWQELKRVGYEVQVFSSDPIPGMPVGQLSWQDWLFNSKSREPNRPFFLLFKIKNTLPEETDERLRITFLELHNAKLLMGSLIVLAGNYSSDWETVPMLLIPPDREVRQWEHRTTHYDVAPTLLKNVLRCTTSSTLYSSGGDLTEPSKKDWQIFGNENQIRIFDFTTTNVVETDWQGNIKSGDDSRSELVLKAAKEVSRFYRR